MSTILSEMAEDEAVAALDSLVDELYEKTAVISHWGGPVPFDGVCDMLLARLLRKAGHKPVERIRSERRRKVFGVKESLVVFKRDNYLCVSCGSSDDLSVDHIQAWSLGGSDDLENLQTLCQPCNSSKGARS